MCSHNSVINNYIAYKNGTSDEDEYKLIGELKAVATVVNITTNISINFSSEVCYWQVFTYPYGFLTILCRRDLRASLLITTKIFLMVKFLPNWRILI